jgi:hypothetical protein
MRKLIHLRRAIIELINSAITFLHSIDENISMVDIYVMLTIIELELGFED